MTPFGWGRLTEMAILIMDVHGDALLLLEDFIRFASSKPKRLADAMGHDPDVFVCCLRCLDEAFRKAADEPAQKKTGKSEKRQPPLPDNFDHRFSKQIGNKIREFLAYKTERNDYYSPTGLRNLLTQIDSKVKMHPEELVIELITDCMANNWKGIIGPYQPAGFVVIWRGAYTIIEKRSI